MTARKTAAAVAHRRSTSPLKRMVEISGAVASHFVREHGPTELLHRLSDPFWFQAFGAVLGCNWQAGGVTTSICAALKEAARKQGRDLGIVVCGGKKTPDEIRRACDRTGDQAEPLIYASRLAAKVDSACIQDGFELSHHTFMFVPGCGAWALVQQGLGAGRRVPRRYHWNSMRLPSFVSDPHTAVACDRRVKVLNLVASEGLKHRQAITALTREHPDRVMREVQAYLHGPLLPLLESSNGNGKHSKNGRNGKKGSPAEQQASSSRQRVLRNLNPAAVKKVLVKTFPRQACDFEELLGDANVGVDFLTSLSLLAEAIYQAPASRRDPASYNFTDGTRDVGGSRPHQERNIDRLRAAVEASRISDHDKIRAMKSLAEFSARIAK